MSKEDFAKAYENADTKKLKKYINNSKVLSAKEIVKYMTNSLPTPKIFDIILQISFAQYNFNKIVSAIIELDNVELLEKVLAYDDSQKLNIDLIQKTVPKGRISMAKMIWECNHEQSDDLEIVIRLIGTYKFVYSNNENSIDSFILAVWYDDNKHAKNIISHINPNFWNDFAIRFCIRIGNSDLVKELLCHPMVDPGVDNNFCLKLALKDNLYGTTNRLLKHPLVSVTDINIHFACTIIRENFLCVAERLLRTDNDIVSLFKGDRCINVLLKVHNDITYLAIKLGILDVNALLQKYPIDKKRIKRYLRNFHLNEPYVMRPYIENLDPEQIYKMSLKNDDIDLAKSITCYPISIKPTVLFQYLEGYDQGDVYNYVWNMIIKEYDPNLIFRNQYSVFSICCQNGRISKLFKLVRNDPRFNYGLIYENYSNRNRKIMRELVMKNYGPKEYANFCKKYGDHD
jgi:hypothetical protein